MSAREELNKVVELLFSKILPFKLDEGNEVLYSLVDTAVVLDACALDVARAVHEHTSLIRIHTGKGNTTTIQVIRQEDVYALLFLLKTKVTLPIQEMYQLALREEESPPELWQAIAGDLN